MQTIILSAGNSTRVKESGFQYQKCMLPMPDGRTLLEWQVEWLNPTKLLYISREAYKQQESGLIRKIGLTQNNFIHVWLQHRTKGPLDGLWHARNYIEKNEELLISYNDELVAPEMITEMVEKCRKYKFQSAIVAFITDNPRFTDVPRSDLSAGCTYYFASGRSFIEKMRSADKGPQNGVPDIVYSYKHRLYHHVPSDKIIELGTAQEYAWWMAQQGDPVENWVYDIKE